MKKFLFLCGYFLIGVLSSVVANPFVLALSDIDVTAITSYAANNQTAIVARLVNGLDIANDIMVMPGVKNKIPMPKLRVGAGARPYSGTQEFKTKGITYSDRFLEVKVAKRELQIDPEDYMGTYLAWVNSTGSAAGKNDIPFEQFLWNQVIEEYGSELNDSTAYKGFDGSATAAYNAGSVYNPGDRMKFATTTNNPNAILDWYECVTLTSAGQSPDTHAAKWLNVTARAIAPGIESYILAGISGSEISPVVTGAINATAGVAIAAFKKLFRAHTAANKKNRVITSCSYTDWEFLLDDLGEKYKYIARDASANGFLVMPETNGQGIVKPATWLGTSRRLVSGPAMGSEARHKNLYLGTDLLSDASQISTKASELWKINVGIKTRIGFQIQDMTEIKVGDQV